MRIYDDQRDLLIHLSPEDVVRFAERERQRFDHLVLGRSRPIPVLPGKPKGLSKLEWKVRKQQLREAGAELVPTVEPWVQLRERWSRKQGTPETHERFDPSSRPGALARLWTSGAISDDQLDAGDQIIACYWMIAADVMVRTANLEPQIHGGAHGKAEHEKLGRIMADLAYTGWRSSLQGYGDVLLAVIVHDESLTVVARRHGIGMPKARRKLREALDLWWVARASTRRAARDNVAV